MNRICYTLLSDGSSDRMLMPALNWLLRYHHPNHAIEPQWADLRRMPRPPKKLSDRIKLALDLYQCDLLFIHRDAETHSALSRHEEILLALTDIPTPPVVCVIPVRMQEAWLLFDEQAIRKAAGNPSGKLSIELPVESTIENLPDPKAVLFQLIKKASGLSGARLKKLKPNSLAHHISQAIDDFSPLLKIPSFKRLEQDLIQATTKAFVNNYNQDQV